MTLKYCVSHIFHRLSVNVIDIAQRSREDVPRYSAMASATALCRFCRQTIIGVVAGIKRLTFYSLDQATVPIERAPFMRSSPESIHQKVKYLLFLIITRAWRSLADTTSAWPDSVRLTQVHSAENVVQASGGCGYHLNSKQAGVAGGVAES